MFKLISEYGFRDLFRHFLFIKGGKVMSSVEGTFEAKPDDNGIVVYNYLDYEMGSTFEALCTAQFKQTEEPFRKDNLSFGNGNHKVRSMLRKGFVNKFEAMILDSNLEELQNFADKVKSIDSHYAPPNEAVYNIRSFKELDSFRSPDYPDDILVFLFRDDLKAERLWVRCYDFRNGHIQAVMLNEPQQDFGVHRRDIVQIAASKHNGELLLYCNLAVA